LHKVAKHWEMVPQRPDKCVFWWLVSFHPVVDAIVIINLSKPPLSFPILGRHWTKRQRRR